MNNQIMDGSMQGAAMTNALTGERSHRTVSFATTGDAELDLISGFVALASQTPVGSFNPSAVARALRYLLNRYEDMAKNQQPRQIGTIGNCLPSSPQAPPQRSPDLMHTLEELMKDKHGLE